VDSAVAGELVDRPGLVALSAKMLALFARDGPSLWEMVRVRVRVLVTRQVGSKLRLTRSCRAAANLA